MCVVAAQGGICLIKRADNDGEILEIACGGLFNALSELREKAFLFQGGLQMLVKVFLDIFQIVGFQRVQKVRVKFVQIGCKGAIFHAGSSACPGRDKETQPVRQVRALLAQNFEKSSRCFIQRVNDQQTGTLPPVNLTVAGKVNKDMMKNVLRRGLVQGILIMQEETGKGG